jgi:hypothetical protein
MGLNVLKARELSEGLKRCLHPAVDHAQRRGELEGRGERAARRVTGHHQTAQRAMKRLNRLTKRLKARSKRLMRHAPIRREVRVGEVEQGEVRGARS